MSDVATFTFQYPCFASDFEKKKNVELHNFGINCIFSSYCLTIQWAYRFINYAPIAI